MALMRCDFFSDVLGVSTSMTVILPQRTEEQIGMAGAAADPDVALPPVLYLLHGLSDDDTTWARRTSIERYVADRGIAVVMPRVERSFYHDEAHGRRYWTFLTQELPRVVHAFFRVSARREDTFVAGLSMGGYGAVRWALRHPDKFAAAASLSGVLDLADDDVRERRPEVFDLVLGGRSPVGTDSDLLHLLRTRAQQQAAGHGAPELPALYVACGTEDELLDGNRAFLAEAERLGVPVTADLGPGEHEWGLWDRQVRDVLDWLPRTPRTA
ncbi:alpha/beta hydrolase family protein [Cellulomonas sp. PhB143]|uniref:alpha/beta hydrolase n=1 Tax=Cellulomonas sp. PhB143 TaxID=2485186 RepID=UPI000F49146E|nr:alpha/beta hydrolase family protein [Cellulomonas sp. PhB143]ROS75289.1 S-formylglutathione hydrolase FrmB [Cellulomonas sp. PhB143]